jgi:hypothetical protein
MDRQGFRLASEPNLVPQASKQFVRQETTREFESTKTISAPDARFTAYAAPMSDGRLVTDYRDKCVTRAPPGSQYAVKNWIVHNTDEIIRLSRDRQVQMTGQSLGTAATELPPAEIQQCTPERCEIVSSGYNGGIGIERADKAPPLFGTFTFPPTVEVKAHNQERTSLNRSIQYGRNTPTRWAHLYQ